MNPNPYTYRVLDVLRVIDGDTVDVRVDLGFGVHIDERFRLDGIDAPELVGADHAAAVNVREWLDLKLRGALPHLWVESRKLDSFRRWLGTFWVLGSTGAMLRSLNYEMLELGIVQPFKR